MASRTDKFMYLDLEFYDESAFGFINFYDVNENAGGTVGFGDTAERRIGFYGTEYVDIFEITDFNDIEVHNYKEEDDQITEYYDSNFIVKANSFKFRLQNPNEVATINLYTDTFNDFIKVEENTDEGIDEEKWDLDNPVGMTFSVAGSFGFVNAISNKMLSVMDVVNEEFTWTGNVNAKDFFNLDGIKVSYEGHTHDNHYTKTESDDLFYKKIELDDGALDNRYFTEDRIEESIDEKIGELDSVPKYKENGYYKYNATNNEWNKVAYTEVDEYYDIPNDADDDTYWFSEMQNRLYKIHYSSPNSVTIEEVVETTDDLPTMQDGDIVYSIDEDRFYEYRESGNYWNSISLSEAPLIKVDHKSDIDTLETDKIYYISSTEKFYEYNGTELLEIKRPNFVYSDRNNLPERPQDEAVYKVKGGTFYVFNGSSWSEIDRPLKIPEIHYDNIDKYQTRDKVVFVTRRK